MKAIVIHKEKDLRIEERAAETPAAGQVSVKLATGASVAPTCITSITRRFRHDPPEGANDPRHEVAGHITEIGAGVEGFRVGQLVGISPSRPCGACRYCREGMPNQCLNMRFYGSAMPFPHIQGAFREHLVADASQCVAADGLSAGEAAMAEPLAVALHATRRAGELLGKSVLVTGCGPIGVLAILAARRAGADLIVARTSATTRWRWREGQGPTAHSTWQVMPSVSTPTKRRRGPSTFSTSVQALRPHLQAPSRPCGPGATILQLGLGGDMTLPMMQITAKELVMKGSFRFHAEYATAISLMRKGLIDVKPLISETVGLQDAVKGFELASDRSRAMKVQIAFS